MIVARYHKFVKGKLTVSCPLCYNAIAIKPHPQVQPSRRGRCPHRPASPLRPRQSAERFGRPYRPPLRIRLRSSRRGGLYARPDRVPIPTGVRWFHRRRGALYMRPCRTAGITGPASEIAGLPGRIYNPPLRCVRPAMVHPTRPPATGSRFLPGTMVQWSDFRPAPHMVRRLSGVLPWVSQ